MIRKKRRSLGRGSLRLGDGRHISQRLELCEPLLAGRRDGKTGHDRDDAIELEGPEGACMHWRNQKKSGDRSV